MCRLEDVPMPQKPLHAVQLVLPWDMVDNSSKPLLCQFRLISPHGTVR